MLRKMFEIRQVAVEFHKENKMVVKPTLRPHHHNLFRGIAAESGQIFVDLHDRDIRPLFSFRST